MMRTGFWTSGFIRWICFFLVCALPLSLLGFPSFSVVQAAEQVYYVDDVNGRDSNNGLSESTPWGTIVKVNSVSFVPGDRILFKRGSHWHETLKPRTSGVVNAPIIFGSYGAGPLPILNGDDTRKNVDVSGRSYLTFQELDCRDGYDQGLYFDTVDHMTVQDCVVSGATAGWGILCYDAQYVLVEDCTVSDCRLGGIGFLDNTLRSRAHNNVVHHCNLGILVRGIADIGSNHNEIDGNDCHDNSSAGIYLSGFANYNLVHNNHSHHNVFVAGIYGEPYGIAVSSSSYNEVYDNELNDNADHGIEVFSGAPPSFPNCHVSSGNKIYRNRIYNNARNGIFIDSRGAAPADNQIYYNLIYDNAFHGFHIVGPTGPGNKFYNNTVVGNGLTGLNLATNGVVLDMKNNIFCDNGAYYELFSGNTYICNITHGQNLYHKTGNPVWYNTVAYTLTTVRTVWEATALSDDPLFVDAANHDFHLAGSSLAIDSGVYVGLAVDFDGNPISGNPDRGAFEVNQGLPPPSTSFTLSGRVTQADNSGLDGVTLSLSDGGGSVTTANGGLYSVTVPSGWSGQVTPSYGSGSFDPMARLYSNVSANQSGQDFRWTAPVKKRVRLSLNQGWNLITVPLQSSPSVNQMFASLPSGWMIYRWDPARLRYSLGTEINLNIGSGYWLKSPITTDVEIEGDAMDAPQFTKDLAMGWNQIGSPSTDSYELSNLRIMVNETVYSYQEAVDQKLITSSIYTFSNNRYESAHSNGILKPGSGYWIHAFTGCQIIF